MASRKNRRATAAIARKNKPGGQKAALAQLSSMLEGLEGMGATADGMAVKLEPLIDQVTQMSAELKTTKEALDMAIKGGEQLHAQLMQQKATFLWLLSEYVDTDLEVLERRFDQGFQALQRKA